MSIDIQKVKTAVILSVLSSPSRLSAWKYTDFSSDQICRKIDISGMQTQEIISEKYSFKPDIAAEMIIEACFKKNINILSIWDDEYPSLLKEIYKPPLVIYATGKIPGTEMVSIVGTRKSDNVSEHITKKIASSISMAGYTVVSGMARGIDRSAHIGALSASGKTVAVLPGGVDLIYPLKNSDIYRIISETGSVVSEYPPGTCSSHKWTFVRRNRIISGMSKAVIVIQAPLKSGAMITARYALEQNRELFACPGNAFDEKYSGCNELIRQGASIISELDDFFRQMDRDYRPGNNLYIPGKESRGNNNEFDIVKHDILIPDGITGKTEKIILNELAKGKVEIDALIRNHCLLADEVNRSVTKMEIEGLIIKKGNMIFRKT